MVVNTPSGATARVDGYEIRAATTSVDKPIITTVQQLAAAVQAIEASSGPVRVRSLQEHAHSLGRPVPAPEPEPAPEPASASASAQAAPAGAAVPAPVPAAGEQ